MVKVRTRDFSEKKPVDQGGLKPFQDALNEVKNQLTKEIRVQSDEVKASIPDGVRVTRWEFGIQRDKQGRLSGISATAAEFG